MTTSQIACGAILAHRFRVWRKIASGPNTEIWAGENTALHMPVALMLLRPHALASPEAVARFTDDAVARAAARVGPMRVLDLLLAGRHGPVLILELGPEGWLTKLVA